MVVSLQLRTISYWDLDKHSIYVKTCSVVWKTLIADIKRTVTNIESVSAEK